MLRIFRTSHIKWKNQAIKKKSKSSFSIRTTVLTQTAAGIFRPCRILQKIYRNATANQTYKYKQKGFSEECKKAFDYLRKCFTDETKVLLTPDMEKIFKLFVESSKHGIGAAVTQQDDKGEWRPFETFHFFSCSCLIERMFN
jgi:hypothetical protein